ncbi:hypothetical protein JZ751_005839 [Albula glossodonta]|uniref:PDZ domain containing ring finger 4 n=1 Tax=Albula glossodonta TaxID=121402 RepID=A0A8T2PBA0_9TELE|nr:hypothetical protein JZ751_005839 [Albula glossodonta]
MANQRPMINGQDVQDREEALDEGWLDDEQSEFLEELKMEMLEEQREEQAQIANVAAEKVREVKEAMPSPTLRPQRRPEEDDITTDTATCSSNNQDKDSGVCRTDDSGRHDDTSEQEVLARVQRRLSQCLRERRRRAVAGSSQRVAPLSSTNGQGDRDRRPGPDRTLREEEEDEAEEEEREEEGRFQQLLELKCQIRNSGEYDLFYSRRSTIECSLAEPEGDGVQRELRLLNEELRSIELECQNIMQAHQLRLSQDHSPERRSPAGKEQGRRGRGEPTWGESQRGKLADITEHPEKSDKDSSSAYNTAESCRSTPLAMDRSPDHSLQRIVSITNQKNLRSTAVATATASTIAASAAGRPRSPAIGQRSNTPGRSDTPPTPPPRANEEHRDGDKSHPQPSSSQYPSPYHSPAPYRHAHIPAHARHYQSYMHLIQQSSAVEYGQSQLSLLSVCNSGNKPEPKMEWKVKIRSDGTRYITKRPVRDRLLRERALKIREERSGGTTTDDDAASELKMGRYWSKEERKQHLLRAREQRRRREFMMRSRLESLRENPQSGGEGARKEVSILELSHRKMMKKRNRKILDNWMTIQELMTHGARAPEDPKVHNAFLSVTTV